MKTFNNILKLTAFIALMAISNLGGDNGARAQSLRDGDYNFIGKITPNGTVRNNKYVAIGFFNGDGTLANSKGKITGRLNKDLNIYDTDNNRIGYITIEGRVYDGESNLLGKIDRNSGKVTRADEQVIGYAHGVSMLWIAAYYFFDFFDK